EDPRLPVRVVAVARRAAVVAAVLSVDAVPKRRYRPTEICRPDGADQRALECLWLEGVSSLRRALPGVVVAAGLVRASGARPGVRGARECRVVSAEPG